MSDLFTITDAARTLGIPPKLLTNWFWSGDLDRGRCEKIGGKTLIPRDYIQWVIVPLLRRRGHNPTALPPVEANR